MKRIVLSLSFLLLLSPIFATGAVIISQASLGMGKAGIADASGVDNPANIASRKENDPSLKTYFTIMEELYLDKLSTPVGYFQYPSISMGAEVFGTNLSLTLNIDSFLEDRDYYSQTLHYTGYNRFILQLDWGYKLNNFDFGMRLKGGSVSKRGNFELRDNYFFFPDYIVNTFFSTYTNLADSDFFSLGFAIRLNISDNLNLAIMSESDLDLSATSNSVASYLKEASIGITYISDIYSEYNQLNSFVYKASMDLIKIGDSENREFRIGNELKMELGNNNSIAFRAGYYESKPTIGQFFVFDSDEGVSTFALSYNSFSYALSLTVFMPIKSYADLNNGFTVGLNTVLRF